MKTTTVMAALAGIALFAFSSPVLAQYKSTGDDGITASPKLRERLDDWNRSHSPAPKPAEIPQMACAKCTDKMIRKVDWTARGANKPTILVATHQCEGCGTDWKVVGQGKAKQSIATHKCTGCGSENLGCCNTSKGSTVATAGMVKTNLRDLNFEVAPVK